MNILNPLHDSSTLVYGNFVDKQPSFFAFAVMPCGANPHVLDFDFDEPGMYDLIP
jgi:hypothetical protein